MFNFINSYDDIWKAIIKPPRQDYNLSDMGPSELLIKNQIVKRTDLRLKNKRGYTIECSYFEKYNCESTQQTCVIYLHANGCSRLESIKYLDVILSNDINLFCFDFSGSGKSEGQYCTLGWFERDDLECVIQYLVNTQKIIKIALWGRSMGAVTALLYAENDPRISCMIIDSPFVSFQRLVEELLKTKANIPNFLTLGFFKILKRTIKSKSKLDLDNLCPGKHVNKINIPTLYAAGINDNFVKSQHAKELYEIHPGPKQIILFEGDHNSQRPLDFLMNVSEFLKRYMCQSENQILKERIVDNRINYPLESKKNISNIEEVSNKKLNVSRERLREKRIVPIITKIFANNGDAIIESNQSFLDHSASAPYINTFSDELDDNSNITSNQSNLNLSQMNSKAMTTNSKTKNIKNSTMKIHSLYVKSFKPTDFNDIISQEYNGRIKQSNIEENNENINPIADLISNENRINVPNKMRIPRVDCKSKTINMVIDNNSTKTMGNLNSNNYNKQIPKENKYINKNMSNHNNIRQSTTASFIDNNNSKPNELLLIDDDKILTINTNKNNKKEYNKSLTDNNLYNFKDDQILVECTARYLANNNIIQNNNYNINAKIEKKQLNIPTMKFDMNDIKKDSCIKSDYNYTNTKNIDNKLEDISNLTSAKNSINHSDIFTRNMLISESSSSSNTTPKNHCYNNFDFSSSKKIEKSIEQELIKNTKSLNTSFQDKMNPKNSNPCAFKKSINNGQHSISKCEMLSQKVFKDENEMPLDYPNMIKNNSSPNNMQKRQTISNDSFKYFHQKQDLHLRSLLTNRDSLDKLKGISPKNNAKKYHLFDERDIKKYSQPLE